MVGQDFLNLFTQPSGSQSSAGFVAQQPNPYSSLPPYIIPQIPTAQSGSPFSMQNFLANLSGSTSTMGGPQIDKQQLATGVQDIKDSKNQKLALMLFALGGALKGDKDFVQNTLALQQMQEGKKKQEAQKKKYQDFLAKLPDGSFKDLATALGPDKLDDLLLERYKAEQPKEKTIADYKAYLAKKYASGEPLTANDKQLEAFIANYDPFERRIRNIPPAGQVGIDTGRINITDISEAEKYPKGTTVYLNGQAIIVD